MTRRQLALAAIRVDVAINGVAGKDAIRAYCEERVSREAFNEACAQGMEQYRIREAKKAKERGVQVFG